MTSELQRSRRGLQGAVPEAIVEALPVPEGVDFRQTSDRISATLPVRLNQGSADSAAVAVVLAGLGVMVQLFLVSFLGGFYQTFGELMDSADGMLIVVAAVVCFAPALWTWWRRRPVRVEVIRSRDSLWVAEVPPAASTTCILPIEDLDRVIFEEGRLLAVYGDGSQRPLVGRIRDERVGNFVALRLSRPPS